MESTAIRAEATAATRHRDRFRHALEEFDFDKPLLILTHHDADGLASGAILARSFKRIQHPPTVRLIGRGENPWAESIRQELEPQSVGGLIVADLGVRAGIVKPRTATLYIDHHQPMGTPPNATVITGFGEEPIPTTGLLAYWCAQELAPADDLLWLAAMSLIGDLAEHSGFPEMKQARQRYGSSVLREATSLINAARRSASGNAQPAYDLLMKADEPREITSGQHPETAQLLRQREEIAQAMSTASRTAPKFSGDLALIKINSPCQIHPWLAQTWRQRLKRQIVMVANTGYRPGWVHFSVRAAGDVDLIAFLQERAPAGADENYGSGHRQATGGALTIPVWNKFIASLGFGAEMQVRDA